VKYRLLGKSGGEWGWGSPKDEAQKIYETYREAAETSLTRRISTPAARAKHSWVSSSRVIATVSF
jgi:hypothetical protein